MKENIKNTTVNHVYKNYLRYEFVDSWVSPNRILGINKKRRGNDRRNWKRYRKTQYKE